ncbi:type I restriction enzyme HsdR N-terminal domain-containing protein [Mesorhizobium sp. M1217]|uniref:type I restriction endonuclease subunit R n=1 Tax=Mesorhizobium sp. M1217 TaxID=2957070 RepID=UPI003337CA7D
MNETDVREIIVRPLLTRLGYSHGTAANIRTEVPLRYDKAFLGRKKPTKDPALAGRADYICDVTSFGRWCVEVKAAGQPLTQDDVEQAHTYSAHPEISASHFLLTNGREFLLFATGSLTSPLLRWQFEETDHVILNLFNIVGPNAIKKLRRLLTPDVGKPLGIGLPSRLELIGGEIRYGAHHSNHPMIQGDVMNGAIGQVTGKHVQRRSDGLLQAVVAVRSPLQGIAELNKLAGLEDFEFLSADEFISTDINNPTIFQNFIEGRLEPGAPARILPGSPAVEIPFGFDFTVFTEATGFAKDDLFEGIVRFDYDYRFIKGRPNPQNPMHAQLTAFISQFPTARIQGEGTYTIRTKPFPVRDEN